MQANLGKVRPLITAFASNDVAAAALLLSEERAPRTLNRRQHDTPRLRPRAPRVGTHRSTYQ